jgi:hypothetical protein
MTNATIEAGPAPSIHVNRMDHIPRSYFDVGSQAESEMTTDELLLNNLDQELQYNPDREASLRSVVGVAQYFADEELCLASSDPRFLRRVLYWTKREDVSAQQFEVEYGDGKNLAYYDSENQKIVLNLARVGLEVENIKSYFKAAGVKLLYPRDPELAVYIAIVGHETGHIKLDALSRMLSPVDDSTDNESQYDYFMSTRAYLSKHPSKRFDPNNDVTEAVFSESFSQGYGLLALRHFLKIRGYSELQTMQVINQVHLGMNVVRYPDINSTAHQIDFLGDPVAMSNFINENNLSGSGYPGKLGYGMEANSTEIDDVIRSVGEIVGGYVDKHGSSDELSGEQDPTVDLGVASYIDSLKAFRREAVRNKQAPESAAAPMHKRLVQIMRQARAVLKNPTERLKLGRRTITAVLAGTLALNPYLQMESGLEYLVAQSSFSTEVINHNHFDWMHTMVNGAKISVSDIKPDDFKTK